MTAPQPSSWSNLRLLLRPQRRATVALATVAVLAGFAESAILAAIAQIGMALVNGASRIHVDVGPASVNTTVGTLFVLATAIAFARLALQLPISVLPARIASDAQERLRMGLFEAFSRASWSAQSRDREGQLQELATNQSAQAAQAAMQATSVLCMLATFAVLVLSALALNVLAAAVVLVVATGLSLLLGPLSRLGKRSANRLSAAFLDYASGVNEAVQVAEETQVFGVGPAQRERTRELVGHVRTHFFRTQALVRLIPGVYQSLIYLLIVSALATLYLTGAGHLGSLGIVVLLLVRAGSYGQQVQSSYQALRQTFPFLDRMEEARRNYAADSASTGTRPLDKVRNLAFEDVSFAYEPGRPVLSEITFSVAAGESVGIVGRSGAGKSTLVQILLGLRTPSSGSYLVNGVPADRIRREDWHRKITYLPQEPRLLHASVAENIRFLRPIDDAAVERAARLAGIHGDIVGWADEYDTVVGPRADAVSGGQQQRICLARALATRPEVLVLDEPTSALDPHSERLIQESLAGIRHELTLFVVAHRMSTLDICERVMVIADGRLEAFDTVMALQRDSAYYSSVSALTQVAPQEPPLPQ